MTSPLTTLLIMLEPDPTRTMVRPFSFGYPQGFEDGRPDRGLVVAKRVLALPREEAHDITRQLLALLDERHRNMENVLRQRYSELDPEVRALPADDRQQLLLAATFSEEYAFESAALFNPSIVEDLDREASDGDTPFFLSLRGIGEGHISSITFRTGIWRANGEVEVEEASAQAVPPRVIKTIDGGGAELQSGDSQTLSETVIFPVLPSQRQGVEDLRMVRFTADDGTQELVGTYTAFDGHDARTELLRGIDFRTVELRPLGGKMAAYKGMALFPRCIDGKYVMLGRMDSERLWLLRSDDLLEWNEGVPILEPKYPWEWVQMGNCGSPVEIDEGWLVMTHGVAFMRGYSMGACLLDRDDPSKVLARTPEPLLAPLSHGRGGYVPNVVYGCGLLVRGREMLVPYAVGDRTTTFATGRVDDVLAAMVPA